MQLTHAMLRTPFVDVMVGDELTDKHVIIDVCTLQFSHRQISQQTPWMLSICLGPIAMPSPPFVDPPCVDEKRARQTRLSPPWVREIGDPESSRPPPQDRGGQILAPLIATPAAQTSAIGQPADWPPERSPALCDFHVGLDFESPSLRIKTCWISVCHSQSRAKARWGDTRIQNSRQQSTAKVD